MEAMKITLEIEWKDHDTVILKVENGDTYTSKSQELMDFLHGKGNAVSEPASNENKTLIIEEPLEDQWIII